MPDLIAAEGTRAPHWPRRLALLGSDDPAEALRLSRDEARVQAQLAGALADNGSLDAAGYRLGASLATDLALIRAARGATLPEGWAARIARAATARLPIAAADLMQELQGPALGRGLKAAEAVWIADGFATPAPDLIETARMAGKERA